MPIFSWGLRPQTPKILFWLAFFKEYQPKMYNPAIMTLIKLIGTSSLSVVQYVKHIGANIPLHYFTKGGSGAEPPKNFLGV